MMGNSTSLERLKQELLKVTSKNEEDFTTIVVHLGICGKAVGADDLYQKFQNLASEADMDDKVRVEVAGCAGLCSVEPMIKVKRLGRKTVNYCLVNEERAEVIFQQHILNDTIIYPWTLSNRAKLKKQ